MADTYTTKGQRIFIAIILAFMIIGTIGGFVAMILSVDQNKREAEALQAAEAEYDEDRKAYDEKRLKRDEAIVKKHNDEYNAKYEPLMKEYYKRAGAYKKESVTELKKDDIIVGEGAEVGEGKAPVAYYIGWKTDGKIFDSSLKNDKLQPPFVVQDVIKGWQEGLKGMKMGGVRELTIPADMAYGSQRQGDIPADEPLKFIVVLAGEAEYLKQPSIPVEILMNRLQQQ